AAVYTETDGYVGRLVEAMAPSWDDTVLCVVSDHDQTTVAAGEPVDLQAAAAAAGLDGTVGLEGGGAGRGGGGPPQGTGPRWGARWSGGRSSASARPSPGRGSGRRARTSD